MPPHHGSTGYAGPLHFGPGVVASEEPGEPVQELPAGEVGEDDDAVASSSSSGESEMAESEPYWPAKATEPPPPPPPPPHMKTRPIDSEQVEVTPWGDELEPWPRAAMPAAAPKPRRVEDQTEYIRQYKAAAAAAAASGVPSTFRHRPSSAARSAHSAASAEAAQLKAAAAGSQPSTPPEDAPTPARRTARGHPGGGGSARRGDGGKGGLDSEWEDLCFAMPRAMIGLRSANILATMLAVSYLPQRLPARRTPLTPRAHDRVARLRARGRPPPQQLAPPVLPTPPSGVLLSVGGVARDVLRVQVWPCAVGGRANGARSRSAR